MSLNPLCCSAGSFLTDPHWRQRGVCSIHLTQLYTVWTHLLSVQCATWEFSKSAECRPGLPRTEAVVSSGQRSASISRCKSVWVVTSLWCQSLRKNLTTWHAQHKIHKSQSLCHQPSGMAWHTVSHTGIPKNSLLTKGEENVWVLIIGHTWAQPALERQNNT